MGIEEYKAYTRQLENDVGKWHHAYDYAKPQKQSQASAPTDDDLPF